MLIRQRRRAHMRFESRKLRFQRLSRHILSPELMNGRLVASLQCDRPHVLNSLRSCPDNRGSRIRVNRIVLAVTH